MCTACVLRVGAPVLLHVGFILDGTLHVHGIWAQARDAMMPTDRPLPSIGTCVRAQILDVSMCASARADPGCFGARRHLPPFALACVCVCAQILDAIESTDPNPLAPVRLPIVDKWRDMGTIVMGKIESGFIRQGDVHMLMPNRHVWTQRGGGEEEWEGRRGR